ncbi:MAG: hypothetical protein H6715_05435 [Myxococcales bacterium]|nr:hypothetical protein [Myxococcales bacterium]MCB9709426.1 hypothetical protein [Myxococcales bacterium]
MSLARGRIRYLPGSPRQQFLRWISGWAFLHAVVRLLGRVLGYRHEVVLSVSENSLLTRHRKFLLGSVLSERECDYALDKVVMLSEFRRFSRIFLILGAAIAALGIFLGGRSMLESARAADATLLMAAAAVFGLGVAADFVLQLITLGGDACLGLEVYLEDAPSLCIVGLTAEEIASLRKAIRSRPKRAPVTG